MATLDEIRTWLADELPRLIEKHGVPGVAIGVLAGDEIIDDAAGVLHLGTGVESTPDSIFQVGSITKVWTTTLVMQLVDEGRLDLDVPIRTYLPEFRIADEAAAALITTRQLLCHTAGFEGDIFTDTGKGDDCVEKFVAGLGDVPQLFPPGEQFSYNNAGFCVLGRLVEVLREKPYDDALREHVFTPLGLTHTANGPYEAIMHRAAMGHVSGDDGSPVPAPVWCLTRSNAPAGAALTMRPRDLLTFVRMHLDGGTAADGTRVLGASSVAAMQQPQVHLPDLALMGTAWGLGWEIYETPAGPMIGHDGGTIGQGAFLRVVPGKRVAVALLTNGGDVIALYRDVVGPILEGLAGVTLPPLPEPPASPAAVDASRLVGTYSADVVDMVVTQDDDGRVWVDEIPKGIFVELGEKPKRSEAVLLRGDTFVSLETQAGMHPVYAFTGDDGAGHAAYLHTGRALPRKETR